ncbi:MAG: hypothetical protein ACOCZM_02505 [Bacillota bacterium]
MLLWTGVGTDAGKGYSMFSLWICTQGKKEGGRFAAVGTEAFMQE